MSPSRNRGGLRGGNKERENVKRDRSRNFRTVASKGRGNLEEEKGGIREKLRRKRGKE